MQRPFDCQKDSEICPVAAHSFCKFTELVWYNFPDDFIPQVWNSYFKVVDLFAVSLASQLCTVKRYYHTDAIAAG